ncbi:MAG: GTP-binding protein [uncultured Thiotrichaceae bacterium]|uniref:GTP-binding protein n=1 Tax=uncultured Thiotrichaceae bacterium TaxID=298394 RepID=A0A6S6TQM5_9GAMM|nr:MAG: GTP-binding protein [uncultured Thiotrichaceae bacterium]
MKTGSKIRGLLALGVVLGTLSLLLFIFFATRSAFDVWERIQELPPVFFYAYLVVLWSIIGFAIFVIYKLLFPKESSSFESKAVDRESIVEELETAEEFGMDTQELRDELVELEARKEAGAVYIALFGDVSTGKSSIIKTIVPDANVKTHIRGGSTQEIAEYEWKSSSGDKLVLTDLPGRNEALGTLDDLVRDEAIRAHVVVYVTDSDITRTQFDDVQLLQSFGKPLLLAVNKSDRLDDQEQLQITQRLQERFDSELKIAFTQSGGMEEIVRIYPDGKEETVLRPRKADVTELAQMLQDEIDDQIDLLGSLRDASVFVLVKNKLDHAKSDFQHEKALRIVKSSTRKAVLGAMASVSPGADLVVQGVLGTLMVKDICKLYDVSPRQLDIDNFLNFSQGHMKKSIPLLMAVAGNGFKAFPGIGTVAGGLIHAVAYGIIFDALGRAVVKTLEERGKLKAAPASLTFKEMLGENLESRAKLFAKLVLDNQKK